MLPLPSHRQGRKEDSHKQAGKGPKDPRPHFARSKLAQFLTNQALGRQAREEMIEMCRNQQAD